MKSVKSNSRVRGSKKRLSNAELIAAAGVVTLVSEGVNAEELLPVAADQAAAQPLADAVTAESVQPAADAAAVPEAPAVVEEQAAAAKQAAQPANKLQAADGAESGERFGDLKFSEGEPASDAKQAKDGEKEDDDDDKGALAQNDKGSGLDGKDPNAEVEDDPSAFGFIPLTPLLVGGAAAGAAGVAVAASAGNNGGAPTTAPRKVALTESELAKLPKDNFVAADDVTVLAYETLQSQSSLKFSLAELQERQVDKVVNDLNGTHMDVTVRLGDAPKLGASLPQFNAADNVTLGIEDAQTGGVLTDAGLGALKNIGVDQLHASDGTLTIDVAQAQAVVGSGMAFAAKDTIALGVGDAEAASVLTNTELATLKGIGVDQIHAADGSLTVGAGQVHAVVDNGLEFAAADTITFQGGALDLLSIHEAMRNSGNDLNIDNVVIMGLSGAEAQMLLDAGVYLDGPSAATLHVAGTTLGVSVASLQALGVDSVVSDGNAVHLALGSANLDMPGFLPHFAPGATVTLGFDDAQATGVLTETHLANLKDIGVDQIHAADGSLVVDAGQVQAVANSGLEFVADDAITLRATNLEFQQLLVNGEWQSGRHIDNVDIYGAGELQLSDAVAQQLLADGISLINGPDPTNDVINVHAEGTVLQSSLHDLQKLGLDGKDYVKGVAGASLNLALGDGVTLHDVASHAIPQFNFDKNDAVELVISESSKAGATLGDIVKLAEAGIDRITTTTSGSVDDLKVADPTLPNPNQLDTVKLQDAISQDHGSTTTAFQITDDLAQLLVDVGLIKAADVAPQNVTVRMVDDDSALSFLMMGDLGVDQVQTSGELMVHLGFTPSSTDANGLDDLLGALAKLGDGTTKVFADAAKVTLDAGSNVNYDDILGSDLTKLKQLGIDEIDTHDSNNQLVKHTLT